MSDDMVVYMVAGFWCIMFFWFLGKVFGLFEGLLKSDNEGR